MKNVLLIIDMQQDFFKTGVLADHKDSLVSAVNDIVDAAHSSQIPVIRVRQEYKNDLSDAPLYNRINNRKITIEKTEGCNLLPELHHRENDIEIIKKRFSAFFNTDLDSRLKDLDADTIIIAGVNTMTCVRVTAIDAYQRDFKVFLAEDCIDAYDEEQHLNSIKYLQYAAAAAFHNNKIIEIMTSS